MGSLTSREKPKIGLLLLTAEWFAQIGASQGSFQGLPQLLEADAARIREALGAELEVICPGVISDKQHVDEAVQLFEREDIDLMVACQITWGEDRLIIHAVEKLPLVPLVVWCYSPFKHLPEQMTMRDLFRSSGPVGALQASAPLKRLGKKFGFVFGSYENRDALKRVGEFSKAGKIAKDLRNIKVGVLPYRCDQMTGTYVDEFRLKKEIGPELKYISTHDYRAVCENIAQERIEAFVRDLKREFRVSEGVTDRGLARGARVSLGLADLVEKHNLDALAIEDVSEELHRVIGLRPCLYVPALFERAVVSMEAEVGGAVALWILKKLANKAPMYTEIFTFDENDNCVLMGHAGIHDITLAESRDDILIEPDGEYRESEPDSCWMRFRAKGGRVTMLSLFCDVEKFKMVISSGESLRGEEKLLGSPHAYVRLPNPLADFFEKTTKTGMTQHWALVHDDVVEELVALADILGVNRVLV